MSYKYPFSKQDGLKNCACACMQMIIMYYKGYISMNDLEIKLDTNKNGTNAYKMVQVFEELGFNAKGYKGGLKELNHVITPFIAFVTIDNKYNHFVVVYKVDYKRETVVIADPADKIKKMSFNDFNKIFNNVVIAMYPVKPVCKNKELKISDFIIDTIINNKTIIIKLLFLSIIVTFFSVLSSYSIKVFFESFSKGKSILITLFISFILIELIKILSNFLRTYLLIFLNKKIDINMNMDVYNNVINLPYQYYSNRTSGEIVSKILDLEKIRSFINSLILTLFMDLPLTIFSGLILRMISKSLFELSLIILLNYVIIFYVSKKYLEKTTEKLFKTRSELSSFMYESINNYETVKNAKLESIMYKKYDNMYSKYLNKIVNLDVFINNQTLIKDLNQSLGELIILFIGFINIYNKSMAISDLLVFNSISMFFFSPIRNLLSLDLNIEESKKAYKRAYEINNLKDDIKLFDDKNYNGDIIINNLNYCYDDKDNILKNINLSIGAGEKVLITGESGSGKSTLLKLLMKYYELENRKKILFNNVDINDISDTRNFITMISQNESLFTDTLFNNINLFDKDIDSFTNVVNDCYVNEIIKNNSLGYNMLIEENGFNISGGQKQRIILARALLTNFDILLVDEGLSMLDVNLERKILKNIFKHNKNKTMIFVSHRLENLDLYDRLVEIKDGKIVKNKRRCK